jgi:hypothetical protein
VLIFSAGQFIGVFAWFSLPDVSLTVPRNYLLLKNLSWALIALAAGAGLIAGRRWALRLTTWGALAFALFQLFDIFMLRSSEFAQQTKAFDAAATLAILSLVLWSLTRPGVQNYFRR